MRIKLDVILIILPLTIFGILPMQNGAFAQSTRDPDKIEKSPTDINTTGKKKKVNKNGYKYKINNAVHEYEDLMKENSKKYSKMQKDMKKPRYSDPTYFGHKKKPKKRTLGKRKMCKECGIVH